jgi:uncharacterized protein YdeI (YjbR/CyaY-like superfamily)
VKPIYFKTPQDLRVWFEKHHETEKEGWIGIYKKNSGKSGITYQEAVDQALCFGWIDGLTKRVDEVSYMIRFTPRRPKSSWTDTNVQIVERLKKEGLMHPAGLAAFDRRVKK